MGGVFAFLGSQYRLEVSGEEYFIDLLLYHRALKCLVAIELKIGKFIPEYVGKMQFYLAVLDDKVRMEDEKPSIGIILELRRIFTDPRASASSAQSAFYDSASAFIRVHLRLNRMPAGGGL